MYISSEMASRNVAFNCNYYDNDEDDEGNNVEMVKLLADKKGLARSLNYGDRGPYRPGLSPFVHIVLVLT